MSASSFISVMVDDEVLVKAAESDVNKVEGSAYSTIYPSISITNQGTALYDPILSWPTDWYFNDKDLQNRGQYEESNTHTTCGWKGMSAFVLCMRMCCVLIPPICDRRC
jgi:hypothetical protein